MYRQSEVSATSRLPLYAAAVGSLCGFVGAVVAAVTHDELRVFAIIVAIVSALVFGGVAAMLRGVRVQPPGAAAG